jgi:hypothetical protein
MSKQSIEYWKGKFELYKKLHLEEFKNFHLEEFKNFNKKYTPMRCDLCPYRLGRCPDPFLLLFPDGSIIEDTLANFMKRPSFIEGWCIEWIKHV